jgi:hypothetical protein
MESRGSRFHRTLAALRRGAGFETPYAFYHRNGGRRAFPFTFAHYLKLEAGESLPRPQWLPRLVALLRIPPSDEMLRRFVTSFLRDFFEADGNYSRLIEPLLRPVEPPVFGRHAVKKLLSEHAYHLTPSQQDAILSSAGSYWAFECLANDKGLWSAGDLAAKTGLSQAELEAGLRTLAKARLVRRVGAGGYKSPLAGRYYTFPTSLPDQAERCRRREAYVAAMTRRRGETLEESTVVLRGTPAEIGRTMTTLHETMEAGAAESIFEPTASTALFLIQARACKAFDF